MPNAAEACLRLRKRRGATVLSVAVKQRDEHGYHEWSLPEIASIPIDSPRTASLVATASDDGDMIFLRLTGRFAEVFGERVPATATPVNRCSPHPSSSSYPCAAKITTSSVFAARRQVLSRYAVNSGYVSSHQKVDHANTM
jgi:hypothetical protein